MVPYYWKFKVYEKKTSFLREEISVKVIIVEPASRTNIINLAFGKVSTLIVCLASGTTSGEELRPKSLLELILCSNYLILPWHVDHKRF